jgi:hypothetical protein
VLLAFFPFFFCRRWEPQMEHFLAVRDMRCLRLKFMFYFPAQLEFFEPFFSFSFLFFFTNNAMNGFQVGHIGCLALVTCSALHFLYLGGNLYLGFF